MCAGERQERNLAERVAVAALILIEIQVAEHLAVVYLMIEGMMMGAAHAEAEVANFSQRSLTCPVDVEEAERPENQSPRKGAEQASEAVSEAVAK